MTGLKKSSRGEHQAIENIPCPEAALSELKKSPLYFLLHVRLEGENYRMPSITDSKHVEFSRLRGSEKSGPRLDDGVNWPLSNITVISLDMPPLPSPPHPLPLSPPSPALMPSSVGSPCELS